LGLGFCDGLLVLCRVLCGFALGVWLLAVGCARRDFGWLRLCGGAEVVSLAWLLGGVGFGAACVVAWVFGWLWVRGGRLVGVWAGGAVRRGPFCDVAGRAFGLVLRRVLGCGLVWTGVFGWRWCGGVWGWRGWLWGVVFGRCGGRGGVSFRVLVGLLGLIFEGGGGSFMWVCLWRACSGVWLCVLFRRRGGLWWLWSLVVLGGPRWGVGVGLRGCGGGFVFVGMWFRGGALVCVFRGGGGGAGLGGGGWRGGAGLRCVVFGCLGVVAGGGGGGWGWPAGRAGFGLVVRVLARVGCGGVAWGGFWLGAVVGWALGCSVMVWCLGLVWRSVVVRSGGLLVWVVPLLRGLLVGLVGPWGRVAVVLGGLGCWRVVSVGCCVYGVVGVWRFGRLRGERGLGVERPVGGCWAVVGVCWFCVGVVRSCGLVCCGGSVLCRPCCVWPVVGVAWGAALGVCPWGDRALGGVCAGCGGRAGGGGVWWRGCVDLWVLLLFLGWVMGWLVSGVCCLWLGGSGVCGGAVGGCGL